MRSLLAVLLLPCSMFGWGEAGHRLVATMAEQKLSPAARKQVSEILAGQSLAAVASWADQIRNDRPETARWHYVDIPRKDSGYNPSRDCEPLRNGDCVIRAVDQFTSILVEPHTRPRQRQEALKFLVHMIADVHQPLHAVTDGDAGGNGKKITYLGKAMNLHALWDYGILESSGVTEAQYLERLPTLMKPEMATGAIVDWALESHQLADSNCYNYSQPTLDAAYKDRNLPVIELQLARAAARLAFVLNSLLK